MTTDATRLSILEHVLGRTVLPFLSALNKKGVSVVHLQRLVDDPDYLDRVVALILEPEAIFQDNVEKFSTLAESLPVVGMDRLLREMFPGRQCTAEDYKALSRLLPSLLRGLTTDGSAWHRAVVVMRYGLGTDGNTYQPKDIAVELGLTAHTVRKFTRSMGARLRQTHSRLSGR